MRIWQIGIGIAALPSLAFFFFTLFLVIQNESPNSDTLIPIAQQASIIFLFVISTITFPYYWWQLAVALWNASLPSRAKLIGLGVCILCIVALFTLASSAGYDVYGED